MANSCCEVLTGRTPVEVVAESERALAFLHTRPSYPVHIVVIPRLHVHVVWRTKLVECLSIPSGAAQPV